MITKTGRRLPDFHHDCESRLCRHGTEPIVRTVMKMDFAEVEKRVLAGMMAKANAQSEHDALFIADPSEELNAGRNHFSVKIRGREVYVTGSVEGPDRSVGIFFPAFEPERLYNQDGFRLPLLEQALTDTEWSEIAEQVEAELD